MKRLIGGIAALAAAAFGACNSQPPAHEPAVQLAARRSGASTHAGTVAVAPAKAPHQLGDSTEPFDSLRAFVGVRPMQFRYVADSVRQGTPTVAGRFIIIHELFQTPRILYRSAVDSTRWFQFKLEPVGEAGTVGGDFTVDTIGLDPQRQTLLLRLSGHNGFWGGSLSYGQAAIVDVTAEPLLLLKTETLNEEVSYGRDSDTIYDKDAAGSESRIQALAIRNQCIALGSPQQTSQHGRGHAQASHVIRPTPPSMLTAGRYQYQSGKMLRVKR
jgi:hypothetical protein